MMRAALLACAASAVAALPMNLTAPAKHCTGACRHGDPNR